MSLLEDLSTAFDRGLYRRAREVSIDILQAPDAFEWTGHEYGFVRLYFGARKTWRFTVWRTALVGAAGHYIHNHVCGFTSLVVGGGLKDTRYSVSTTQGPQYHCLDIRNNVAASLQLVEGRTQKFRPGDFYRMGAREIHRTVPLDGTVTINRDDRDDEAPRFHVFWPWGTAKPVPRLRTPTKDDVREACAFALARMLSTGDDT